MILNYELFNYLTTLSVLGYVTKNNRISDCIDGRSGSLILRYCPEIYLELTGEIGSAIAQAVSRWFPTAAARVWSSGICGGQSGAGADFLRVLRFPVQIFIPPNSPSSQSPGAGYNRPISGRRAE
jgi:hypothetical protein